MKVQWRTNYSVSVECSLPGNGILMYDFSNFDMQSIDLIRAVDAVQKKTRQAFTMEETDEHIVITMRHYGDKVEIWSLPKTDRAVDIRNCPTSLTWKHAYDMGTIRILQVMNRRFPVDIQGGG